jgi:hypothetical protein
MSETRRATALHDTWCPVTNLIYHLGRGFFALTPSLAKSPLNETWEILILYIFMYYTALNLIEKLYSFLLTRVLLRHKMPCTDTTCPRLQHTAEPLLTEP